MVFGWITEVLVYFALFDECFLKQIHLVYFQLFPACKEPCMIGLQPFVSLDSIGQFGDYISVLSKGVSQGESVWSIYLLQKPDMRDLLGDMVRCCTINT